VSSSVDKIVQIPLAPQSQSISTRLRDMPEGYGCTLLLIGHGKSGTGGGRFALMRRTCDGSRLQRRY
jgi:hypothetical protein